MATLGGPKVVNQGMGVMLDPSNPKIIPSAKNTNLLDYSTWIPGNTSATGFGRNGSSGENIIEKGIGPFGEDAILWASRNNDTSSGADGGWNGGFFNIDPSYMYRFSVWMNRPVRGNGYSYLGVYSGSSSSTNNGVLRRSNGSSTTNHYFTVPNYNFFTNNTWYLMVGHMWPEGSGAGAHYPDSGIYNTSGTRLSGTGDAVWKTGSTRARHRSYLYYSTDPATVKQWAYPRVDKLDGTEPSINELINGGSQVIVNPVKRNVKFFMKNNLRLKSIKEWGRSRSINTFDFDGTDDIIETEGSTTTSLKRTVEIVFRVNNVNATYMPIACYTRGGQQSPVTGKRVWLGVQSGRFRMHGWGTTDPNSTTNITNGDYYHAVYSYDQTTKRHQMWINGILERNEINNQGGQTGWNNSSDHKWFVGGDPDGKQWSSSASTNFDGEIAIFRTYDRILSPTEVKINYGSLKRKYDLG